MHKDETERSTPTDKARDAAVYGFIALVVFVVLLDRFAPVLWSEYAPLGDTALGLLLGAITALIVGEGFSRVVKD